MAKGDSRGVPGVGNPNSSGGASSFTNSPAPSNYGGQSGPPSNVPAPPTYQGSSNTPPGMWDGRSPYQSIQPPGWKPSVDRFGQLGPGGLLPPMQGTPNIKGGDLGGIDNDALLKLLQQMGLTANDPNRARTMMGQVGNGMARMGMGQGNRGNLSQVAQRSFGNMGGGFGRPPINNGGMQAPPPAIRMNPNGPGMQTGGATGGWQSIPSMLPTPQGNTGIMGGQNRSYAPAQFGGRPY